MSDTGSQQITVSMGGSARFIPLRPSMNPVGHKKDIRVQTRVEISGLGVANMQQFVANTRAADLHTRSEVHEEVQACRIRSWHRDRTSRRNNARIGK
jgi:hypothetical protein